MKTIGVKLLCMGLLFLATEGKSATQFELGDTIGTKVARGGARVFTFSGYKNQVISVRATAKPKHSGIRLKFQLFSPEEKELLATAVGRPSAELNQFILSDDGLHTFILFDQSSSMFKQDIAWVTIIDNQSPDEMLELNETVNNTLQISDIDVYGFEARAGETAVLSVMAVDGILQPNLAIISPEGKLIANVEGSDGSIESTSVELPLTGSYSILIKDKIGIEEGTYAVTLNIQMPEDVDTDGLGDDWEREVFGDLSMNGADDQDLDGVNNRIEFVRGMNPLVQDSGIDQTPPPLSIRVGTVDIEFLASKWKRYQLEGSSDFLDWNPLGRVINGNNQTVKRSFSVTDNGVKYFRLVNPTGQ